MNSYIPDKIIMNNLKEHGFTKVSCDEGRLMLLELLSKAGAGYYNSHTEELFLRDSGLIKVNRTPNRNGMKFICSMVYTDSNGRPPAYDLMAMFRNSK